MAWHERITLSVRAHVPDDINTRRGLEGWHMQLNLLFPKSNMTMSQFILRIQKEDERTYTLGVR